MSSSDLAIAEVIADALADEEPSWVTLPPTELEVSDAFALALEQFDAGSTPAGEAATEWLKRSALAEYQLSRTALYIANGAIAGYYSLASSTIELSQRERKKWLGFRTRRGSLPATLITWIAKDHRAEFDGSLLVMHAAAVARRAMLVQASVALVLDPFDDATTDLWITRHGFRRTSGKSGRLWIPLG